MNLNRRNFLRKAGIAATLPLIYPQLMSCVQSESTKETKVTADTMNDFTVDSYGIQLWSVKEDMAKDAKGTLKSLAGYGYKQIESFGGEKGIFWGMTPADFKNYTSDLGLSVVSSHCDSAYTLDVAKEDEFRKLAADAASVGLKYLINPFPGPFTTKAEWEKVAAGLNRQGEICKANGLRAGYHNHHIEFLPLADGTIPEKLLMEQTDASLVDFELDLYWVVQSGNDPIEWLKNYKDRYRLCHIKDLHKQARVDEIKKNEPQTDPFWPVNMSTVLGNGQINFDKILPIAKEVGVEYFIVEQERYDDSTPMADVEKDAKFMEKYVLKG